MKRELRASHWSRVDHLPLTTRSLDSQAISFDDGFGNIPFGHNEFEHPGLEARTGYQEGDDLSYPRYPADFYCQTDKLAVVTFRTLGVRHVKMPSRPPGIEEYMLSLIHI